MPSVSRIQWLRRFRAVGRAVQRAVRSQGDQRLRRRPLGRGAGGDETYGLDRLAEETVLAELVKMARPGETFTVISEECGTRSFGSRGPRVLVDPIDGSTNARREIPYYRLSLALAEGETLGSVTVGYLLNLASGETFWAVAGRGSFRNGSPLLPAGDGPLHLLGLELRRPSRELEAVLPLLRHVRKIRCLGALALDLGYLASGAMDAVLCPFATRGTDLAAGYLIVHQAGGRVTDLQGGSLDHRPAGLEDTAPFLAARTPALHRQAMQRLEG